MGPCWRVFLVLGLVYLPPTESQPFEVKAGVVMVEKSVLPFKMEMVGPAIDIAMEEAERLYGIRFVKYERLYPYWCNSVASTGAIADLYHQDGVRVLIGPGCSGDITVCGKLATHWRLPQVTGVGDLVLGKEDYPTLTRLSYSLEKQSGQPCTQLSVTHLFTEDYRCMCRSRAWSIISSPGLWLIYRYWVFHCDVVNFTLAYPRLSLRYFSVYCTARL